MKTGDRIRVSASQGVLELLVDEAELELGAPIGSLIRRVTPVAMLRCISITSCRPIPAQILISSAKTPASLGRATDDRRSHCDL